MRGAARAAADSIGRETKQLNYAIFRARARAQIVTVRTAVGCSVSTYLLRVGPR